VSAGGRTERLAAAVRPRLPTLLRLAGLVVVVVWAWGAIGASQIAPHPLRGVWLVLAVAAWTSWALTPHWRAGRPRAAAAAAVLGIASGVLFPATTAALAFSGVAASAVGAAFELPAAAALAAFGPAAAVLAALVSARPLGSAVDVGLVALTGLVVGLVRRQGQVSAQQAASLALEHERMALERARADILEEKNRLAREMHDVLAHSLGGLAVELEALGAIADAGEDLPALRARLARAGQMARDGLAEARDAVRALRDEPAPIGDRLARLCRDSGADVRIFGTQRPIAPEAALTVYRVAQEALTNAGRHAPGAARHIELAFAEGGVSLSVRSALAGPAGPPGSTAAGGFGLQGMRERARLAGGTVEAGPARGEWRVRLWLPA